MSLTEQEIAKIAKLSRIKLSDEESKRLGDDMSGILKWIEMLQEVDTEGVAQMTSVADVTLPLREDKVTDGDLQADVLKNSPNSEYGYFIVPKVVE